MARELATYPSESTFGKKYHIIEGSDGTIYCDCWQWKRKRTCKHLTHYLGSRPTDIEGEISNIIFDLAHMKGG